MSGDTPPVSPCGNCTYVRTRKFGWVLKHSGTCPQHKGLAVL